MPNSSPPKRATMSPGRRWARRRGATACSSSSPAWWPMLSLITLKWSRSRKRTPTGEPEAMLRRSASRSESMKLSRLGRPVRESCRTRWRSASSALWRTSASARTLAEAWTKWTSCGVKWLGSVEWMSSTPKGRSLPAIGTARLLRMPSTRSAGGIEKRRSLVQSSTITCRPDSSAAPACESRAAEARRSAPPLRSSRPARRCRRRPSRPASQTQAASTPSISVISGTVCLASRAGSPSWRAWRPSRATAACCAAARCSSCSASLRSVMS